MPDRSPRRRRRSDIQRRSELKRLLAEEQEDRLRALDALSIMRGDDRISLEEAADRADTSPEDVEYWVGEALSVDAAGNVWADAEDDLAALMYVVTTDGVQELMVRGSESRQLVREHHGAIGRVLRNEDPSAARSFGRWRFGTYRLETDSRVLYELWRRGELDFVSIYVIT